MADVQSILTKEMASAPSILETIVKQYNMPGGIEALVSVAVTVLFLLFLSMLFVSKAERKKIRDKLSSEHRASTEKERSAVDVYHQIQDLPTKTVEHADLAGRNGETNRNQRNLSQIKSAKFDRSKPSERTVIDNMATSDQRSSVFRTNSRVSDHHQHTTSLEADKSPLHRRTRSSSCIHSCDGIHKHGSSSGSCIESSWSIPQVDAERPVKIATSTSSGGRHDDDNKVNWILSRKSCHGPKLAVFSGGSAFNSLVGDMSKYLSTRVSHILPISDNGGSSREIVRVLGGPAVGDIRSRLIRLATDDTREHRAMKQLLEYRLTSANRRAAKEEMLSIVAGSHPIWRNPGSSNLSPRDRRTSKARGSHHGGHQEDGQDEADENEEEEEGHEEDREEEDENVPAISEAYKQTVRAFLAHFFDACLRRASVGSVLENDVIPSCASATTPALYSNLHQFSRSNSVNFSPFRRESVSAPPTITASTTTTTVTDTNTSCTANSGTFLTPQTPLKHTRHSSTPTVTAVGGSAMGSSGARSSSSHRAGGGFPKDPYGNADPTHYDPEGNNFDFRGGSIGNFVFTGARLFFHSLDAAVFWFSNLSSIPPCSKVMPVINVNTRVTIGATLEDGTVVIGQDEISHPTATHHHHHYQGGYPSQGNGGYVYGQTHSTFSPAGISSSPVRPYMMVGKMSSSTSNTTPLRPGSNPGANLGFDQLPTNNTSAVTAPCSDPNPDLDPAAPRYHPSSSQQQQQQHGVNNSSSNVDKEGAGQTPLPSPIRRIFYVNQFGGEIVPHANQEVLKALQNSDAVIYSIGSLYTSIIPSLIVPGVGDVIRSRDCPKLLLLNGKEDRETFGMKIADYVVAIAEALVQGMTAHTTVHTNIPPPYALYTNLSSAVEEALRDSLDSLDTPSELQQLPPIKLQRSLSYRLHEVGLNVTHFVTDVLYIDSECVRDVLVPQEHVALLKRAGVRLHAVPSAAAAAVTINNSAATASSSGAGDGATLSASTARATATTATTAMTNDARKTQRRDDDAISIDTDEKGGDEDNSQGDLEDQDGPYLAENGSVEEDCEAESQDGGDLEGDEEQGTSEAGVAGDEEDCHRFNKKALVDTMRRILSSYVPIN